jgi:DNA-binding CsgD family transcriptional regulator
LTADQLATLVSGARLRPPKSPEGALCATLTARERSVLQTLATGASRNEAARELSISVNTVQAHLRNAMRKLNAPSKLAAVLVALRAGAIDEPAE